VNLTIPDSQSMVIIGPSGCGKSVLLKHIMGLLRPDRGTVLLNGQDVFAGSLAQIREVASTSGCSSRVPPFSIP